MTAKLAWLAVNLALVLVCFWLVERCLPFPFVSLDRPSRILILLTFFNLSPTRIAIENGQTTLFVLALMLIAILLAERSWLLAGVLFGLALSKYSVSLSVALFFLYHRNYRVLVTAVIVQILGFVALALISGNSIILVFTEYLRLFISLIDQPGIHLAALIPGTQFDMLIPFILTLALAVYFYFWMIRNRAYERMDIPVFNFHILTIFVLWSLVVAYHRLYDALLLLFLIVLVYKSLSADIWKLDPQGSTVVAYSLGFGLAILIVPARIVGIFLPDAYSPLTNEIPGIIVLIFLFATIFLLRRSLLLPGLKA